jgi:uncharacterized protein
VILTADMQRVVEEQRLGFVATTCPDGTPNLSPKGTTAVWDDEHIVFADLYSPRTIANLKENPSIEINVVDQVVRKGYRFRGVAVVLSEGRVFDEILAWYRRRGLEVDRDGVPRVKNVVLVEIEIAAKLISPAYDSGATEEEVASKWKRYWNELREG